MICLVSVSSTEMRDRDLNRNSRGLSLLKGQAAEGKHMKGSQVLFWEILENWRLALVPSTWLLSPLPQYACPSLWSMSSRSFPSEPGHASLYLLLLGGTDWGQHLSHFGHQGIVVHNSCVNHLIFGVKIHELRLLHIPLNNDVVKPFSVHCGPSRQEVSA